MAAAGGAAHLGARPRQPASRGAGSGAPPPPVKSRSMPRTWRCESDLIMHPARARPPAPAEPAFAPRSPPGALYGTMVLRVVAAQGALLHESGAFRGGGEARSAKRAQRGSATLTLRHHGLGQAAAPLRIPRALLQPSRTPTACCCLLTTCNGRAPTFFCSSLTARALPRPSSAPHAPPLSPSGRCSRQDTPKSDPDAPGCRFLPVTAASPRGQAANRR